MTFKEKYWFFFLKLCIIISLIISPKEYESLCLVKPTLFPSLLVFFMNTKHQTGKKWWKQGLMWEGKVDSFSVSYPGLFYALSCLHYVTQFLLLFWPPWMLESYFRRSRACQIQTFLYGANHRVALGSH